MADTTNNKIKVIISDQAGGKTVTAELPTTAQMSQLIPALVSRLTMPQGTNYELVPKNSNTALKPTDTLASANVKEGDTLRLMPNVIAGQNNR